MAVRMLPSTKPHGCTAFRQRHEVCKASRPLVNLAILLEIDILGSENNLCKQQGGECRHQDTQLQVQGLTPS